MSQSSLPCRGSSKKIGAAEHQRGGGRVVVVGPGGGQPRPVAALSCRSLFHVGRVVVIGHDDGPAAIAAGNHDEQVAFVACLLVSQPAAPPGEIEIGLPAERQSPATARPVMPLPRSVRR